MDRDRFTELKDKWYEDTSVKNGSAVLEHPAAKEIIDAGDESLPYIMEIIDGNYGIHLFSLLNRITGCSPVPKAHRGVIVEMRKDWKFWYEHIYEEKQELAPKLPELGIDMALSKAATYEVCKKLHAAEIESNTGYFYYHYSEPIRSPKGGMTLQLLFGDHLCLAQYANRGFPNIKEIPVEITPVYYTHDVLDMLVEKLIEK